MKYVSHQKIAGLLMVISGIQFMLMVTVAEALYPGYNTGQYTLSSLADLPIQEPSATIFNATTFIAGLLVFISAYLVYKHFGKKIFPVLLAILGIGAMGVGIFPGYTGNTHVIFALTSFTFGSLAILASFTILKESWLKYVLPVLGTVAFLDIFLVIFLQEANPFMALGEGGAERLIVYPIILSIIALGGYLSGAVPLEESKR